MEPVIGVQDYVWETNYWNGHLVGEPFSCTRTRHEEPSIRCDIFYHGCLTILFQKSEAHKIRRDALRQINAFLKLPQRPPQKRLSSGKFDCELYPVGTIVRFQYESFWVKEPPNYLERWYYGVIYWRATTNERLIVAFPLYLGNPRRIRPGHAHMFTSTINLGEVLHGIPKFEYQTEHLERIKIMEILHFGKGVPERKKKVSWLGKLIPQLKGVS